MNFQRVPDCTQLERLAKSGDKVVVCRPGRSPDRDSREAQSRTSSTLNYRLKFESRQQRVVDGRTQPLTSGLSQGARKWFSRNDLQLRRHTNRELPICSRNSDIMDNIRAYISRFCRGTQYAAPRI